jgi:hypothetical protein
MINGSDGCTIYGVWVHYDRVEECATGETSDIVTDNLCAQEAGKQGSREAGKERGRKR